MDKRPVVALGEAHMLQEFHDLLGVLLHHPELPTKINDIAVEFGSSHYQGLIDRFVLDHDAVSRYDLAQVLRQLGDPFFNAPIYENFFRTVRAVNWTLPPQRRIRVLLGQPPVTMNTLLSGPPSKSEVTAFNGYVDRDMAAVVEREVLARGRRALLIGGSAHMLKGLKAAGDPSRPNAASTLELRHPGSVYSVDILLIPPDTTDKALVRLLATARRWPTPSLVPLKGTWLGALTGPLGASGWVNSLTGRALTPADRRYDHQADSILWLGPGSTLTASQADPAIYRWGEYPIQLTELDPIIANTIPAVLLGLFMSDAPPNWFDQFPQPGQRLKFARDTQPT
jgi:hypothetical protein